MYFRVFGPLEIVASTGQLLPIPPREQSLITMLLLEQQRTVPLSRLIDAVWDDAAPRTARKQIQMCASTLRRVLRTHGSRARIVACGRGYSLWLDVADQTDLCEFEARAQAGHAAARKGRLDEAAQAFRNALVVSSGEPLAGTDSRIVQLAANRLKDRRLAVAEAYADIRLMLPIDQEAISDLQSVVSAHPFHERLHARLMLALAKAGRTAEALAVYQRARRHLVEELGLEPGDELRRLNDEILQGRISVELTPYTYTHASQRPSSCLLPALPTQVSSREELLSDLVRVAAPVHVGGPLTTRTIVIDGQGGVGKTTLATQLAHRIRAHCDGAQLYANLGGSSDSPRRPLDVLQHFLRVLQGDGQDVPDDVEQCAEVYRWQLAQRRALVVLDDVADEEQIAPLRPGAADCVVIVTSRLRLSGLAGVHPCHLEVLTPEAGVRLLTDIAGTRVSASIGAAKQVIERCGGLPLAISTAGAKLAARPHWTINHLAERLCDKDTRLNELTYHGQSVRESISRSVRRLAPGAQLLFRRLPLVSETEFSIAKVAASTGHSEHEAADLLDCLVDLNLVQAHRDSNGVVRFRIHELTMLYARELQTNRGE